jgi:hypothetical protein
MEDDQIIRISREEIAIVFTEWDRRWRENPQEFTDLVTHLTKETPLSYGQACAPYFIKLAKELLEGES